MTLLSILNSVYLSFTYLESFILNGHSKEFVNNLVLALITPIFIISVSLIINIFRKGKINISNQKINIFRAFIILLTLILVAFSFWLIIYDFLKSKNSELLVSSFLILFEIVSISFAIQKRKEKDLFKLIAYISFWAYLAIMCSTVTGIFIKYLGYERLDDSNMQLVFIGVFYHLLNACFLFYNAVHKMSI